MAFPAPFSSAPERRTHLDLDAKFAGTYFSKTYYLGQTIPQSFVEFKNKRIGELTLAVLPSRLNHEVAYRNLLHSNLQIAPLTVPLNKMISEVEQVYELFDAVNVMTQSDIQNKYLQLLLHALIRSAQLVGEFEDRLSLWIKGERQNEHATVAEAISTICMAPSGAFFLRLHDLAFSCMSSRPFCASLREYCTSTAMMTEEVVAWVEAQDSGSDTETEDTDDIEDSTTKDASKESDE